MDNFNDLKVGDFIWFSKEGNIGQYRVKEIDKENNKLVYQYNDGTDHTIEIPFDYKSNRNAEFFSNPSDAFDDARIYANTYFKIINPGTHNAHAVYKSPEEISIERVKQILFD